MSSSASTSIVGRAELSWAPEIPLPLEEMIYAVTSQALEDAGLDVREVGGSCMAASDLNDGRAISTMTLTGSTGSFHKTEMRLCNESLSAVLFAAAEIAAGASDALIVCSWSKLSDVEPARIGPLSLEPSYHRALGFHPAAITELWKSRDAGTATLTPGEPAVAGDVAAAFILTTAGRGRPQAQLTGFGASMGHYAVPRGPLLQPLREAVDRACADAGLAPSRVAEIAVVGLHDVGDDLVAAALDVDTARLTRQGNAAHDYGYAGGVAQIVELIERGTAVGPVVVASAAGVAHQNAFAVVMESA